MQPVCHCQISSIGLILPPSGSQVYGNGVNLAVTVINLCVSQGLRPVMFMCQTGIETCDVYVSDRD